MHMCTMIHVSVLLGKLTCRQFCQNLWHTNISGFTVILPAEVSNTFPKWNWWRKWYPCSSLTTYVVRRESVCLVTLARIWWTWLEGWQHQSDCSIIAFQSHVYWKTLCDRMVFSVISAVAWWLYANLSCLQSCYTTNTLVNLFQILQ